MVTSVIIIVDVIGDDSSLILHFLKFLNFPRFSIKRTVRIVPHSDVEMKGRCSIANRCAVVAYIQLNMYVQQLKHFIRILANDTFYCVTFILLHTYFNSKECKIEKQAHSNFLLNNNVREIISLCSHCSPYELEMCII